MTERSLRRIARLLAKLTIVLGVAALFPAILKGDGFVPALASLAVGVAVLVATRER